MTRIGLDPRLAIHCFIEFTSQSISLPACLSTFLSRLANPPPEVEPTDT